MTAGTSSAAAARRPPPPLAFLDAAKSGTEAPDEASGGGQASRRDTTTVSGDGGSESDVRPEVPPGGGRDGSHAEGLGARLRPAPLLVYVPALRYNRPMRRGLGFSLERRHPDGRLLFPVPTGGCATDPASSLLTLARPGQGAGRSAYGTSAISRTTRSDSGRRGPRALRAPESGPFEPGGVCPSAVPVSASDRTLRPGCVLAVGGKGIAGGCAAFLCRRAGAKGSAARRRFRDGRGTAPACVLIRPCASSRARRLSEAEAGDGWVCGFERRLGIGRGRDMPRANAFSKPLMRTHASTARVGGRAAGTTLSGSRWLSRSRSLKRQWPSPPGAAHRHLRPGAEPRASPAERRALGKESGTANACSAAADPQSSWAPAGRAREKADTALVYKPGVASGLGATRERDAVARTSRTPTAPSFDLRVGPVTLFLVAHPLRSSRRQHFSARVLPLQR
ncbi:hypothetical protein CDD83_8979 [Cordyceps sp. RAO-2017]|nr:hypothetical protein CDD83_8979 [Cordyceps sp. RAO-2017]